MFDIAAAIVDWDIQSIITVCLVPVATIAAFFSVKGNAVINLQKVTIGTLESQVEAFRTEHEDQQRRCDEKIKELDSKIAVLESNYLKTLIERTVEVARSTPSDVYLKSHDDILESLHIISAYLKEKLP